MNNKYEPLTSYLSEIGICINEKQIEQFDRYYDLLVSWNEKMNLTAITDFEGVLYKHFIDSCSLAKYLDLNSAIKIIDVGTGAGFPGIPLKIIFPNLKITLLDSLNKRLIFLEEIIKELGLLNIHTVHGRAEDISREKEYREEYDICVSRAVANLSTLTELCSPFVKKDGLFVPYKSEKTDDEVLQAKNALFLLGCKVEKIENFEIKDNARSLVFIRKVQNTSKIYPRKAGTPAKKPL